MLKRKINLQLFADLDEILESHAEELKDLNVKDSLEPIQNKLKDLGYDVLFNQRERAEFVPSSRLSEIVQQRDNFKGQVEQLNATLEELKGKVNGDVELTEKYDNAIKENNLLLQQLETAQVNSEIAIYAKDAIDVNDILAFINYDNITKDKQGKYIGVKEEVNRLKESKPYLFGKISKDKGGSDAGDSGGSGKISMNLAIRRAAGK